MSDILVKQECGSSCFVPLVDIFETPTGLKLIADMPGVSAETLSVDLEGQTLTISGQVSALPYAGKSLLQEYETGDYYRQFTLSGNIDGGGITALLKDGVLELNLPRLAKPAPQKIKINTLKC